MRFQTVYWDACVFHALFSADGSEAERLEACNKIHKAATEGVIQIYTSTLTFVECVWIKGVPKKLTRAHETAIQKYFAHKFIKPVICDRTISESARVLVWQYGVQPKDAVHVASAAFAGVDVMHTYDDALLKLSGKIPCGQSTLRIEKPTDPNPPPPAPPKQAALPKADAPPPPTAPTPPSDTQSTFTVTYKDKDDPIIITSPQMSREDLVEFIAASPKTVLDIKKDGKAVDAETFSSIVEESKGIPETHETPSPAAPAKEPTAKPPSGIPPRPTPPANS